MRQRHLCTLQARQDQYQRRLHIRLHRNHAPDQTGLRLHPKLPRATRPLHPSAPRSAEPVVSQPHSSSNTTASTATIAVGMYRSIMGMVRIRPCL
jgi:hypothetical protein